MKVVCKYQSSLEIKVTYLAQLSNSGRPKLYKCTYLSVSILKSKRILQYFSLKLMTSEWRIRMNNEKLWDYCTRQKTLSKPSKVRDSNGLRDPLADAQTC